MRIISKFNDYYDGLQRYGAADDLLYIRDQADGQKPFNVDRDMHNWIMRDTWDKNYVTAHGLQYVVEFEDHSLLFCGKFYPRIRCVVKVANQLKGGNITAIYDVISEAWGPSKKGVEADARAKAKLPPRDEKYQMSYFSVVKREEMERLIANYDWLAVHQEYGAPVLAFEERRTYNGGRYYLELVVKRNPRLRDSNFASVIDPNTAYQEIAMYLGTLVKPDKEMVELSDKEQIAKKGFDKWSFRKPPENAR
jgi:hypothetical protein